MTPPQYTAAHAALQDLGHALADAYLNGTVTEANADEFLRAVNALSLLISLKPQGPQCNSAEPT